MSGYLLTKQAEKRLLTSTAVGNPADTTDIGNAANRTDAARKVAHGLVENAGQLKLQELTNGLFVYLTGTTDGGTGTFELWGYPLKGDAEFLGQYTYTTDEMVASDGGYYVDAFVEAVAGQITVTISNHANGKAFLKFDAQGYKFIVGLITIVSAGTSKLYLRPF